MKFAERSIAHFWAPTKSHLYGELKRLSARGHVRERRIEQDQRPDKRLYTITPSGEGTLRAWLMQGDVSPDPIKSEFSLRVFFGHLVGRETVIAQFKEMRRQAGEKLTVLRAIEREIKDRDELFYPYLTLRLGLAITRAKARWADESIDALQKREES